jgi:predicted transglutaminase-like cysteine proteinase
MLMFFVPLNLTGEEERKKLKKLQSINQSINQIKKYSDQT